MYTETDDIKYEEYYKGYRIYSGLFKSEGGAPVLRYFTTQRMTNKLFPSIEAAKASFGEALQDLTVPPGCLSSNERNDALIARLPLSLKEVKRLPMHYPLHIMSVSNSYFALIAGGNNDSVSFATENAAYAIRQYADYGKKWWAFRVNV